jgi:hypothetical protein
MVLGCTGSTSADATDASAAPADTTQYAVSQSINDTSVQFVSSTTTVGNDLCNVAGGKGGYVWQGAVPYKFIELQADNLTAGATYLLKLRGAQTSNAFDNASTQFKLYAKRSGDSVGTLIGTVGGENHMGMCGTAPCEGRLTSYRSAIFTVPATKAGDYLFYATWAGASSGSSRSYQPGGALCPLAAERPQDKSRRDFFLMFDPALTFLELYKVDSKAQNARSATTYQCFVDGQGRKSKGTMLAPHEFLSTMYVVPANKTTLYVTGDLEVTVETGRGIGSDVFAKGWYRLVAKSSNGTVRAASPWTSPVNFGQDRHHDFMNPILTVSSVVPSETITVAAQFYWDATDDVAILGTCNGSCDPHDCDTVGLPRPSTINAAWSGLTIRPGPL